MKKYLLNKIKDEKFNPKFIGFFINHNYSIRRLLYEKIKSKTPLFKGKILDFGCGSKPYEHLFENIDEYIGIDYKIEGRAENVNKIDFYYDGKVIPFENKTFDGILCTEVLEHVFNIEELLKEFNRVLKPNGKVLITTPFMWEEHEMPYDFARYTTPALVFLYEKYGFEIKENIKSGNSIYVIFQFCLNYLKNILTINIIVRQIILLPFIFIFNLLGVLFGFCLPKDTKSYFNNIFILEKKYNL